MNPRNTLPLALSAAFLLMLGTVAEACPNCKEALAADGQGMARGIFYSILFMLSMPFLIFSGLSSYFYWEVCKARAQKERAAALAVKESDGPA